MPNILMVTLPTTRHFKEKFVPRLLGFPKTKLCRKFEVPSSSSFEDMFDRLPKIVGSRDLCHARCGESF